MILLDYIAEKGTRIPREANSDIDAVEPRCAGRRAASAPARTFPEGVGPSLIDDHIPFLEAGVRAIDLIDFDYRYRDTIRTRPTSCRHEVLTRWAKRVADLLLHWGR